MHITVPASSHVPGKLKFTEGIDAAITNRANGFFKNQCVMLFHLLANDHPSLIHQIMD